MAFTDEATLGSTDFIGIVLGPKGKELSQFGIVIPKNTETGKDVSLHPRAPYFATGSPASTQAPAEHAFFPLFRLVLGIALFVFSGVTFFIWLVLRARAKAEMS